MGFRVTEPRTGRDGGAYDDINLACIEIEARNLLDQPSTENHWRPIGEGWVLGEPGPSEEEEFGIDEHYIFTQVGAEVKRLYRAGEYTAAQRDDALAVLTA